MIEKVRNFFVRDDPEYDAFVDQYQAKTWGEKVFFILIHLVPGLLGYLAIHYLRLPLMDLTGLPSKDVQWLVILVLGIGWMIGLPVFFLMRVDKLSFREALRFLGFGKVDWRGILLVMPVLTILILIPAAPFVKYVHPVLFEKLNAIPALNIPDWHITHEFYKFPLSQLVVVLIANYLGEEIYFRGYLMKKIGFFGAWTWLASNVLFELYHIHQAPNNWPYVLIAFLLPFGMLMQWRKSIYPVIAFHVIVNHVVPLIL